MPAVTETRELTLPAELTAMIPPDALDMLRTYTPRRMPPELWARTRAQVCALAARADPINATDAKVMLAALTGFLAWSVEATGDSDLATALTTERVNWYVAEQAGRMSAAGLDSRRGRLRRGLRVLAGEPSRTRRAPQRPGAAPYTPEECARLLAVGRAGYPPLVLALGLGAGAGVIVPAACGAWVHRDGDSLTVVTGAGQVALVHPDWVPVLATCPPDPFTRPMWNHTRKIAAQAQVVLLADRLRASWVHRLLSTPAPFTVLQATYGMSRADLANCHHHLDTPEPTQALQLLRG